MFIVETFYYHFLDHSFDHKCDDADDDENEEEERQQQHEKMTLKKEVSIKNVLLFHRNVKNISWKKESTKILVAYT